MRKLIKNSKLSKTEKGEVMVEAAVVFPLVILVVVSLIYIMAFVYNQVATQSKVHMEAIKEAGINSETYKTSQKSYEGISTSFGIKNIRKTCTAQSDISFQKKGILQKSFQKNIKGDFYTIDEKSEIRIYRFIDESI